MNSVLQCLTHTPPLAEALLSGQQWDPGDGLDPLYLTQQHVIKALRSRSGTISPLAHANTLRRVCNRWAAITCLSMQWRLARVALTVLACYLWGPMYCAFAWQMP